MAIEIDFGRELGRVAFPDDVTDEQAQSYVRENYQAIRQGLIGRRQEELAAETEAEEKAKFQLGQYGTVETALNTLSELPRGALEGTGVTLKGAARAATFFPPPTVNPYTGRKIEQTAEVPLEQEPLYRAGQAIQEFGKETYPGLPGVRESLPAQVMGGIGSTVATLPAALIAGPAAPLGAAISYGLQSGESAAEEADTTINRRIAEAMASQQYDVAADLQDRREQMKNLAFITAAPIGAATEGLLGAAPKVARRFVTGRIGGIGERLAESLVPKSAKYQRKFLGATGAERVRGAVEALATEGVQESAEQLGGNIAAAAVYDPERGWLDGVAQAGFVGSLSGGIVGGLVGSSRNAKLAGAANEALGGDPTNPLPRANATVAGLEDTQQEGEPEITAEDVLRRSQEAGLPGQEEVVTEPVPKVTPVPAQPQVDAVRLDDLRKKANAGTINPDELAELTEIHQAMNIPAPVVGKTPTPAPTPAAATVDPETGLAPDEQDELDQLITAEDEGMLSEEGAITLADYRARLGGVKAVVTPAAPTSTPVATPVVRTPEPVPVTPAPQVTTSTKLPKNLAGAKPRYSISQDTYLPRFDSDFDLAAYIVTQTKKSDSDADYLKWAVERSGMTPEEVRKHGLQVRAELKKLAAKTKAGTAQKPAALVVPSVTITMPEVKVTATPVSVPVAAPVTPAPTPVAPTPTPAPEYTPARINSLLRKLKAKATAVGKGLYEIKNLAPGQRLVLRTRFGGLQETDQFLLQEKSQVTGYPSDEGFILRDKQEAVAGETPRPAPKPAPIGPKPDDELTEQQYYDARVKEIARDNKATQAEVREQFSREDSNLEHWQAIRNAAESGKQLKVETLNRLPEARIEFLRKQYPQSVPQGYMAPAVSKSVAEKQAEMRAAKRGVRLAPAPAPATVTTPTPAPAPAAITPATKTANELAGDLALLRAQKPRPLKKLFGPNPTEKQKAAHKAAMSDWEKQYRKLAQLQKRTLDQENANRTSKVRPASPGEQVQPPAAAGAPMQEGIDNIKFVSEPVAQARGGGMDAKDAKAKLVQQLERAVEAAPAESDQQYRDLISTGQTDLEERFKTVNDKNMGAGFEAKYRKAHELGKQLLAKYGPSVPKVTIEIPGDGTYTIANTKQALNQVLAKAQKLNTSTAKGPVRAPAAARKPERANEMLMRMAKQATQVYGKNAAAKLREQAANTDLELTDAQRNDLKVVADMITPVVAEPTEAELQAAEEARLAQAEQEIDAGPIGQAKQKLEDEGSDMKKSQVKAMARKLEASGVIDDSELDDEGRDTGVDELVGQLLERVEEARDTAIQEREQELADEAKAEKAAPKTAAQSAIDAIDKVSKGLSENSYSDPLFLTPLAKLALQIAKGLIQVGVAVDKAIRQAIAQARQQFPNDPTDDIQLADRLIRDAEYTAAVAAGDMETAQRMVDEAAVKAGYKTKGFHRTPKAFTKFIPGGPKAEAQFWTTKAGEFRTLFGQSGRAIWFGSSPENLPAYHNDSTGSGVVLEVYLKNPSPLQIDDDTRAWGRDIYADGSKQFPLLLSDEHIQSIRKDGYTGIEYWNNGKTADKSAPDEMVVFDANQIKSADPVTRDDEGNVVPLSQRFQASTADIRGASGLNRGIGKRLSDWARNDTDEATRRVRFTNPSTGEQATFGDVISDLQSISDEAAPEYVRWLQSIPNKSTATADIVSDITFISRLDAEAERNQRPDRVEAILKKVIAATDPKGKVFEAITGLSNFVVYQASKIALQIYQATKSWVAARNAGMDYIKSHVQLSNEAETAANFEEFIKAFPNQEIPAGTPERPQPPSPDVRVPSRGLFLGDISTDTDENWASEARKWVDFYKGNLERAFQFVLTADIDNAFKEYILGEIIQRNQLDIARAKNDVEVLRALNLEKRLADSKKSLGAVTAKAMAARNLSQERFWWAQPAMIYRNLIRKRQDELIPFSKIESEQVRKWLTESGREAVNQIREAMKKADAVFAREFRKIKQVPGEPEGPPIEIKWQDILTKALDTQGSVRQKMLQVILADPRLRNLSPAGIAEITNLLTNAWETKRNQIFRAEFQKKVPLPNVKPDVREKLFRSLPRILKYANIARATPGSFSIQDGPDTFLLWNQAFRDAVAPEFGVAELNGITARKITDLAQKAQAQSGVNRNEIIQQMFRLMAREGGVKFSDALRDYWYAAVLSGLRTQVDNGANVFNGFLNTAMFATMAKKDAGFIAYSSLKGLAEGIQDFWPILWKGELFRSANFNPDQPGSALEGLGESRNLFAKGISQFKYVSRLITALDHINALMSDSSAKAYALRKLYDADVARQYLTPSPEVVAVARARAIAEGTRPELVNKRTREIIQENLPVEILLTSKEIREMATFTEIPQGLLGSLYRGLDQAAQGKTLYKVLSGTNFLRFAANSANEILNFALPVALYRWYQSAPGRSEGEYGLKFSESRRDLILAKAAFGTALGIFAGALFLGDDDKEEDRNMDITGSFKSLDPNKRKQLLSEGRQPYSIRFGNTYVSYRQMGFGGVLATIGELRDRQLFSPDKWSQENIVDKVLDGAAAGMFIVKDSTAISGLTELLGFANAYKYDTDEFIEKSFPRYVSRLAGSLVPNILKEVDAWSDPSIFKTEAGNLGYEYFLQQVPFGRREIGPGPILNVLGEPVKVERYPWSRWAKEREVDTAWSTLGSLASKGVFMPVPAITVKVNENGTRRELTREEKYSYQQAVGQGYRKFIEQNRERLLALPPAQASDFIDKNADRIRRNARTNLKNSF
jgi:hypothetical protein